MPFLKWFKSVRGWDPEYCAARLVQYLCNEYDKSTFDGKTYKTLDSKLIKGKNKSKTLTGIYCYGICKELQTDIEYLYAIYPNSVKVYDVIRGRFTDTIKY